MQYMKTNRRLWKYIVFSILTLGIYGIYFISRYAKDINTVCEGDGKKTRGFLFMFIFTILTLGIYAYVWYYCVGERIYENCAKRGIPNTTNGGKILLWDIVGSIILVGPFVAMHKIIEGLNKLCADYNTRNGLVEGAVTPSPKPASAQQAYAPPRAVESGSFQQAPTAAAYGAPQAESSSTSYGQTQAAQAYGASRSLENNAGAASQPQSTPAANTAAQEAASVINGALATAGKAAQNAQQFVQKAVSDINHGAEENLGMKWLPLVALASAALFLVEFIVGFYSRPSLFSIIAALGLALLCYLKSGSVKPYAPIPFTVISVQLLQTGLWLLGNRYYYILWYDWLVLLVGILAVAGCVLHWLTLSGNLSMGKNGVFILLGAYALPAVLSIVLLLTGNVSWLYCLANVAFSAAYLILFYRSHFELLTQLTATQVQTSKAAVEPVAAPSPRYAAPAATPVSISQPDPMYERELNMPRIEVEPRVSMPARPITVEVPAPVAPAPQISTPSTYPGSDSRRPQISMPEMTVQTTSTAPVTRESQYENPEVMPKTETPSSTASSTVVDSMISCSACGFLSPMGTTACPNCGAPLRTPRRRRAAAYD